MSARSVQGSAELGKKIRLRRNELGFTIEEAAAKAGVGAKTWSRYETGCSIRQDKVAYICQTLHWKRLPGEEGQTGFDIGQYKSSPAWSQTLADTWGDAAAVSFVIGSDILLDYIRQDLEALSAMPKGSHIGELEISWLDMGLPQQFLMEYDYDFLYYLQTVLLRLRMRVAQEEPITIRTVAEEVLLCLAVEESRFLMEEFLPKIQVEEEEKWDSWPFDLCDDMDVVTFLYSGSYITEENPYHFTHWREEQFHCD